MIVKSASGDGFFAYVKCSKCGHRHGLSTDATMTEARETEALLLEHPVCLDCVSFSVASIVSAFTD